MIMNKLINIGPLVEKYVYSNTPSYLYDSFKSSLEVQESSELEIQRLLDEFRELITKEINSLEDLVYAYALYVAIILKNNSEAYNFIMNEGNVNFEWFPYIRDTFLTNYIPNQSQNFIVSNNNGFVYKNNVSYESEVPLETIDF